MDKEGNVIVTSLEDRLVSTSLDTLKSLPNVIGVAAGENRREAVKGTLTLGVCGALAQMIKKMHNFVHFLPCRLPKEPKNPQVPQAPGIYGYSHYQ